MRKILLPAAAIVALCGSGFAQQHSQPGSDYMGQTWVGLLTSGDCSSTPSSAKKEIERASDMTTSGRTTTPAVDKSGTRGSAMGDTANAAPNTHDALPRTGDVHSRDKESIKDPGWSAAKKQAGSLAAGCGVTAGTQRFSLLLPDGSTLRFDERANASIVQQLKTRGEDNTKPAVLRVRVTGKVQEGQIALDSIRM